MNSQNVIGGIQAAERSKSYDLLELYDTEEGDSELMAARDAVLKAEAARAEQLWGGLPASSGDVESAWKSFRELRAWKFGQRQETRIDLDVWLSEFTSGIALGSRAIVHMLVDDDGYLQLFWVADGGARRDAVYVGPAVAPVLHALTPWVLGSRLRPSETTDPVGDLIAAAVPIADALRDLAAEEGFDHLVLVPWRALHSVPWSALVLSDGSLLQDVVRVTHVPAVRMLRHKTEPSQNRPVVAIADHGSTLAWADVEAEAVAMLYDGHLVADGADITTILQGIRNASIVHLAGHGGLQAFPLAAAILGGNPPVPAEKVLSAARLHLSADLAQCNLLVLNACDSGRYAPPQQSFENHTGVDSACLRAGAKVVISSLWPINDFAATLVGLTLHHNYALGAPPHIALERAVALLRDGLGSDGVPPAVAQILDRVTKRDWRLELDERTEALRHPYWWAAWRLSGADWLFDSV